jgi:adenosine deaminase
MYNSGVIYTDIMFSPAHAEISGMRLERMLEVVTKAIDEVRADTNDGIVATLSMTAVNAPSFIPRKDNTEDKALEIDSKTKRYGPKEIEIFLNEFDEIKLRRPEITKYVTSFGIAGAEGLCLDNDGIPVDTSNLSDQELVDLNQFLPFSTAFKKALDSGLILRSHVGEGKGVKSVWDLVKVFKDLGVEENFVLDHGLEVANDAELTKYISERAIYFTNTFSSNIILNSYDKHNHIKHDMATHPIFELQSSGINANRIGLGGDDNIFFVPSSGSGVKYNYRLLLNEEQKRDKNFDASILLQYTKAAVNMPFVPDAMKQSLNEKITNYESIMQKINTSQSELGK